MFVWQGGPLWPRNGCWLGLQPGLPHVEASRCKRARRFSFIGVVLGAFFTAWSSYSLLFSDMRRQLQIQIGTIIAFMLVVIILLAKLIFGCGLKTVAEFRDILCIVYFVCLTAGPIISAIVDTTSVDIIYLVIARRLAMLSFAMVGQVMSFGQVAVRSLLLPVPGFFLYFVKCYLRWGSSAGDHFSMFVPALQVRLSGLDFAAVICFSSLIGGIPLLWLRESLATKCARAKAATIFPSSVVPSSSIGCSSSTPAHMTESAHGSEVDMRFSSASAIVADQTEESTTVIHKEVHPPGLAAGSSTAAEVAHGRFAETEAIPTSQPKTFTQPNWNGEGSIEVNYDPNQTAVHAAVIADCVGDGNRQLQSTRTKFRSGNVSSALVLPEPGFQPGSVGFAQRANGEASGDASSGAQQSGDTLEVAWAAEAAPNNFVPAEGAVDLNHSACAAAASPEVDNGVFVHLMSGCLLVHIPPNELAVIRIENLFARVSRALGDPRHRIKLTFAGHLLEEDESDSSDGDSCDAHVPWTAGLLLNWLQDVGSPPFHLECLLVHDEHAVNFESRPTFD